MGRGSWSPRRSGKEEQNWSLKVVTVDVESKSKRFVKMMLTMINRGGALHPPILLQFSTYPVKSSILTYNETKVPEL